MAATEHTELTFGILGMSAGNGHPYSWAAIFNGYDAEAMADCPFPRIPEYLGERRFPGDRLDQGRVTRVWTQDRAVSEHIARASLIDRVVDDYREFIGQVDAVLLARDDAGRHLEMSLPFIEAGLPIYIDKPLALACDTARRILAAERFEGQIFTCSALSYASEFILSEADRAGLGEIRHVDARAPGPWDTHGIHVIEPTLAMLGEVGAVAEVAAAGSGDGGRVVTVRWEAGVTATFTALGERPGAFRIGVSGSGGEQTREFGDSFTAFRSALGAFCEGIRTRRRMFDTGRLMQAVQIIERGR